MRQLVMIALLAATASGACLGSHKAELRAQIADVERVEGLFPLIEELGVDAYWVDDDCRYFHYPRGSFSNDTRVDGSCRVWSYPDPRPFDDQADRDIDRLIVAIDETGIPIVSFSISHEADTTTVGPGSFFEFDYCNYLLYEPGYPESRLVPEDSESLMRRLTDDWYESACS
jgi:hypothetical protein